MIKKSIFIQVLSCSTRWVSVLEMVIIDCTVQHETRELLLGVEWGCWVLVCMGTGMGVWVVGQDWDGGGVGDENQYQPGTT